MEADDQQRLQITRRVALAGGGAGLAALLAACGAGGSQTTSAGRHHQAVNTSGAAGVFGSDRIFRFTIVNHETESDFFQALRYGLADACTLLGCRYDWVGSASSDIGKMIIAINRAVADQVNGIATTLIAPGVFDAPVADAIAAGIPVLAYNTDVPNSPRMSYIGQNLLLSGEAMGKQISDLLPGGGQIVLFLSTPGTANVKQRLAGVQTQLTGRPDISLKTVATGTSSAAQLASIQNFVQTNANLDGYFAIDAGSTSALAATLQSANLGSGGVVSGGFDPTPQTMKLLSSGYLNFVVDQQVYLQGFMAILELYLYAVSEGQVGIGDVDTGLQVIDRKQAAVFTKTLSRFDGSSANPGVVSSS